MAILPLLALTLMTTGAQTLTGLDVLASRGFEGLKGKRIGLITNHTGLDHEGKRNVDALRAGGVQIAALFSPEHGIFGREDREGIGDSTFEGIRVYSLYGETRRPTPEALQGLDALVFDIQDVGVRFYTYETTMAYALESAAKAGIRFVVLDRPNPIGGVRVEGPPLDAANVSFVGYLPGMPVRHGMTMGELATMFNVEKSLGAQLTVVPMQGWRRGDWFDDANLMWVDPSPNMRSLKAAILYPGLCLVEFARNLSVGRGTDSPFEQVGADWIEGRKLATYLNDRKLPGLRFYPTRFTPNASNFKDVAIEGVRIEIVDRQRVKSVNLGIETACALQKLYPGRIDWSRGRLLIGHDETIRRIAAGDSPQAIEQEYAKAVDAFTGRRARYLLYR